MNTQSAFNTEPAGPDATGQGQYLSFILAGQQYGIDVLNVLEIKGITMITPIPDVPEHIRGVINLRGNIIPIIDLRLGLQLDASAYNAATVVIVVKVRGGDGERIMGLIVDAVSDVHTIDNGALAAPPNVGAGLNTDLILGIATVDNKMLTLLDMDELVGQGLLENACA